MSRQSREPSEREFRSLLVAEPRDEPRLREHAAIFGVPPALRAEAWRYFLGMAGESSHDEYQALSAALGDGGLRLIDSLVLARVRIDLKQFFAETEFPSSARAKFEHILLCFVRSQCGGNSVIYHKRLIYWLHPFFVVFKDEREVYFGFSRFVLSFETYLAAKSLDHILAKFLMLLRSFFPELLSYIEDEELSQNDWALPWLRNLLCTDLSSQDNVLRLIDTYISATESFDLHVFVCLAILQSVQEEVFDMEFSEMKGFLRHLPPLRLDSILAQAFALLGETRTNKLLAKDRET